MRMLSWRVLLVAITTAAPLCGQGKREPATVQYAADCRLAAQVIRTGEPPAKTEWARDYIGMCRDEGPAVLAQMWGVVGADSAESRYLVFHSSRIADGRLYAEMRRVVADANRPDVVRVAAMLVLVQYANPNRALDFADVTAPVGPVAHIPLVHRWSTGTNWLAGAIPLPSGIGAELVALLTRVAESEPDNRAVSYAAAVLSKRIQTDIERGRID